MTVTASRKSKRYYRPGGHWINLHPALAKTKVNFVCFTISQNDRNHSFKETMRRTTLLILLLTPIPSQLLAAETAMRPGLWEVTTTSNILNYASQMSPEQQQQLKDLANEYGFEVPEIQNGAAKSSTCITPEQAAQKLLPNTFQNQVGCTVNNIQRDGNHYRMNYTCDNPQLKGYGVAEGTFTTPETFNGKTQFQGTAQGIQVNEEAEMRGKWVNSSCETATP